MGFTLVEMMVVVAIIAILATVAAPKMYSYILTAETTEAVEQAGRISRAIQAYADRNLAVASSSINAVLKPSAIGNLVPAPASISNQITSLIPDLVLPNSFAFKFLIYGTIDASRTASICIKAVKVSESTRFILYSSQIVTVAGWEGHVYRKIYLDGTGTPVAGGGCTSSAISALGS